MYTANLYLQMKEEDAATVEQPPHNHLFNMNTNDSPVLRCRQEAQKANALAAPAAPIINVTFGNEVMEHFDRLIHPQANPAAVPAYVPAPAPAYTPPTDAAAVGQYDLQCLTIMQTDQLPGCDMPIIEFCAVFDLGNRIEKKLLDNSYQHARMLRFITIQDLKEMDFHLGEIAMFHDGVERWCAAGNA
jgi:hypothetical protein